jgi:hypothetical protein
MWGGDALLLSTALEPCRQPIGAWTDGKRAHRNRSSSADAACTGGAATSTLRPSATTAAPTCRRVSRTSALSPCCTTARTGCTQRAGARARPWVDALARGACSNTGEGMAFNINK